MLADEDSCFWLNSLLAEFAGRGGFLFSAEFAGKGFMLSAGGGGFRVTGRGGFVFSAEFTGFMVLAEFAGRGLLFSAEFTGGGQSMLSACDRSIMEVFPTADFF